jgi:hypothetical protein
MFSQQTREIPRCASALHCAQPQRYPVHDQLGIFKNFTITERFKLQFRTELFNAFNDTNFSTPGDTSFGDQNFGTITGTDTIQRQIQFGLKVIY